MRILTVVMACLCLFATPLLAETYSWTDASGTVNFTEDYYSIPAKYRKQVIKLGDMGGEPAASQVPDTAAIDRKDTDQKKTGTVSAEKDAKDSSPDTSYGGRKLEEWKRDFEVQEGEMKSLEAKAKEEETVRKQMSKSGGYSRDQLNRMYESHNATVDAYNKAIERYNLLLESAKKAGVPFKTR